MGITTIMYNNSEICKIYHNFIFNSFLKCKKFYLMKPVNNKLFINRIIFYFQSVKFNSKLQTRRYYGNITKIWLVLTDCSISNNSGY
jgi:hypothetical protein